MDIAPVIAPARRFGDDRFVQSTRPGAEPLGGGRGRQRSVAGQVPVDPIRKLETEFGVFPQLLKEARRTFIVVKRQRVRLDFFERPFAIPDKKVEQAGRVAPARGVPVGSVLNSRFTGLPGCSLAWSRAPSKLQTRKAIQTKPRITITPAVFLEILDPAMTFLPPPFLAPLRSPFQGACRLRGEFGMRPRSPDLPCYCPVRPDTLPSWSPR